MSDAAKKRECLERLYGAWLAAPGQRLGEFIVNAVAQRSVSPLFFAADETVCSAVEQYAAHVGRNPK